MLIDFAGLKPVEAYEWMSSLIVPRPIAWVSTLDAQGRANLAPFSFFQMVTGKPPTLLICPLLQRGGKLKDTVLNIDERGEFVVNLATPAQAAQLNETSFPFEAGVSEFEACGVTSAPSQRVAPPRVAAAAASFECKLAMLEPYPRHAPSCHLVLGEVLVAHVQDDLLDADGKLDPGKVDLLFRMGGEWYGRSVNAANFTLPRPR
ncbi:flavin reductase family protein [Herbaspirillum seropedicae]|uniref:flavin reductase family protein n=1 Tax=Herbaspirillum seropedicae TaxID=964 RepID=UPI00285C1F31|nr:flavin reductase family protein [Herbaspirillum seropedicae]MDR6396657.1 flavin reductase (DIM6/NTAB) family NADH-FMN oxidoreductase RutF [Herbaspirillum seropedicae]